MSGDVCIPNIGPHERRKRARMGIVFGAIGLAIAAGLAVRGVGPWVRLGLFLPFLASAVGFLQAHEKT